MVGEKRLLSQTDSQELFAIARLRSLFAYAHARLRSLRIANAMLPLTLTRGFVRFTPYARSLTMGVKDSKKKTNSQTAKQRSMIAVLWVRCITFRSVLGLHSTPFRLLVTDVSHHRLLVQREVDRHRVRCFVCCDRLRQVLLLC